MSRLPVVAVTVAVLVGGAHAAQAATPARYVVKVAGAGAVAAGSPFALTASVAPKATGSSVQLQRHVATGWQPVANGRLSGLSSYTFRLSQPKAGTFSYRVVKSAAGKIAAGTSATVVETVRAAAAAPKPATPVVPITAPSAPAAVVPSSAPSVAPSVAASVPAQGGAPAAPVAEVISGSGAAGTADTDAGVSAPASQDVSAGNPSPSPTATHATAAEITGGRYAVVDRATTFYVGESTPAGAATFASWAMSYDGGESGQSGKGAPPAYVTHAFTTLGDHTATLTTKDSSGVVATASSTVSVVNPPTAKLTADSTTGSILDGGHAVVFDGSASTPSTGALTSWWMDYGDAASVPSRLRSGSGTPPATLQHTYETAGVYNATLTVVDASGAENTASVQVTAYDPNPHAALYGGRTGYNAGPFGTTGQPTYFGAEQSKPGYGNTISSWSMSFDDGTDAVTGTGAPRLNVTHAFPTAGAHVVTLTVSDSSGKTDTARQTVTVVDAPVAVLTADKTASGLVDGELTVTFDPTASTVAPGHRIVRWDFGHGDCCNGEYWQYGDSAPAALLQHTYKREATFTAELRLSDDTGAQATAYVTITTYNPNPTAVLYGGRTVAGAGNFASVGQPTYFSAVNSRPGYNSTLKTARFSFDDNSADVVSTAPLNDASHTFTTSGVHTVKLTVTNAADKVNTTNLALTVTEAPTATMTADITTGPIEHGGLSVSFDPTASAAAPGRRITGWTFRSGECCEYKTGTGAPVGITYTYASEGTFTATLTVADDLGGTASATVQIRTVRGEPTASLTGGRYGYSSDGRSSGPFATVNQSVPLNGSGSRASTGSDLKTWTLSFDDDTPEVTGNGTPPGCCPFFSHTFRTAGIHVVTLVVNDTAGRTASMTFPVSVLNPPTAVLTGTVAPASTGFVATFDGSESSAPTDQQLASWWLDYGDGTVDHGTGAPQSGMKHAYAQQPRTAILTVGDSTGAGGQTTYTFPTS